MLTLALPFLALFGLTLAAQGQEPVAPLWRVTLDVEVVSVPTLRAVRLLPKLRSRATFEPACAELQQLVAQEEAELVGWPIMVQTIAANSPAEGPWKYESQTGAEIACPGKKAWAVNGGIPQHFGEPPPSPPTPKWRDPLFPWYEAPTDLVAWWKAGVWLAPSRIEVAPDGATMNVALSARWSEITKFDTLSSDPRMGEMKEILNFPRTREATVTATAALRHGKRALLGLAPDPRPTPAIVVFLVKCTAVHLDENLPLP